MGLFAVGVGVVFGQCGVLDLHQRVRQTGYVIHKRVILPIRHLTLYQLTLLLFSIILQRKPFNHHIIPITKVTILDFHVDKIPLFFALDEAVNGGEVVLVE